MDHFEPNWRTDPDFGQALLDARSQGVTLLAYDCKVTPETLEIGKRVEIVL